MLGAGWSWLDRHRGSALAIIVVGAVVVQLPFLRLPLNKDEGGFLFVAQQWGRAGTSIYGDQWVDRPPLLLLLFKVAALLGGSVVAVRLVALVLMTVSLGAAFWVGREINGSRGAVVAALIAAGVSVNYGLDGYQLTGEAAGVAFVLLSCALTLTAWARRQSVRDSVLLAVAAGFAAGCAFLVKQSFIDGGLFAAVFLAWNGRAAWRLLAGEVAGLLASLGLTAVWASSAWGPGLEPLWNAVIASRRSVAAVLATGGSATDQRWTELIHLAFWSGIVVALGCLAVELLRVRGQGPTAISIAVLLLYDLVAIRFAGSYWPHYLLTLTPPLVLAAGLASMSPRPRLPAHWVAMLVAACGVASVTLGLLSIRADGPPRQQVGVLGDWLDSASNDGDSLVVAYGSPDLIQRSGLRAPYPYSWSLQVRARDPHLDRLTELLAAKAAPTWIVEIGDFDWWGLDTTRFAQLRTARYALVERVCGRAVYRRNDRPRDLPPTPPCD